MFLLNLSLTPVENAELIQSLPRWRLAVESSPAKRHTPTLHDPLLLPRLQNCSSSFPRGDRAFKLLFVDVGERRIFLKRMFLSSPQPCVAAGRASIDEL